MHNVQCQRVIGESELNDLCDNSVGKGELMTSVTSRDVGLNDISDIASCQLQKSNFNALVTSVTSQRHIIIVGNIMLSGFYLQQQL